MPVSDILTFVVSVVLILGDPAPEIAALASYISEIKKIKHPYDEGMPFRKGIEH